MITRRGLLTGSSIALAGLLGTLAFGPGNEVATARRRRKKRKKKGGGGGGGY
jgi:hypothetical protein